MSQEKLTIEQAVQRLSDANINNNKRVGHCEQQLETIRNENMEQTQSMVAQLTSEITALQTQTQEWRNATSDRLETSEQQWISVTNAVRELTNDIRQLATSILHGSSRAEIQVTNQNYSTELLQQHQTSTPNTTTSDRTSTPNGSLPQDEQNTSTTTHMQPSTEKNSNIQTIIIPPTSAIPIYHGNYSENPRQFLIRVKEYSETINQWNDYNLLNGISQFLRDTALEWYCQLRMTHRRPQSWAEFTNMFLTQFNSPIRRARQEHEWKECKQKENETINEFIVRLRTLWSEQKPHETEADLIRHLLCKMRSDLLQLIGTSRDESLDAIIKEAQKVEEILYQRAKYYNENELTSSTTNTARSINNYNKDARAYSTSNRQPNKTFFNATKRYNNSYRNYYNNQQQHYPSYNNTYGYTNQSRQLQFNEVQCTACGIYGHTSEYCRRTQNNQYQQESWEHQSKNINGAQVGRDGHAPM